MVHFKHRDIWTNVRVLINPCEPMCYIVPSMITKHGFNVEEVRPHRTCALTIQSRSTDASIFTINPNILPELPYFVPL